MSDVFIFEIKGAKKVKIVNFLKGSFSVMRGPMNMTFGVFSEKTSNKYNFAVFFKILQKR